MGRLVRGRQCCGRKEGENGKVHETPELSDLQLLPEMARFLFIDSGGQTSQRGADLLVYLLLFPRSKSGPGESNHLLVQDAKSEFNFLGRPSKIKNPGLDLLQNWWLPRK